MVQMKKRTGMFSRCPAKVEMRDFEVQENIDFDMWEFESWEDDTEEVVIENIYDEVPLETSDEESAPETSGSRADHNVDETTMVEIYVNTQALSEQTSATSAV
ncbi:hypothetical protein Btru_071380 [Bulinus truncatus]|nr:hypothetical protein Btru_071380 [Bulinus truncatus]